MTLADILSGIKKYSNFLKSKWRFILLTFILGVSIGLYFAIKDQFKYIGQLSFVLEDDNAKNGSLNGAMGIASQFGIDIGGASGSGVFSGANLLELMKSRKVIEKVLREPLDEDPKFTVADLYLQTLGWQDVFKNSQKLINFNGDGFWSEKVSRIERDSLIGIFHRNIIGENLSIDSRDKKSSIIDVKFICTNEKLAKKFVERLVAIVGDFYIETKTKKTLNNIKILQRQVDSVRFELNTALGGVVKVADETFNLNPAFSVNRLPSQKRQIDVQANTVILTELVKNLEIAKIDLRRETPLIQVVDAPVYPLPKSKLSKTKGVIFGGLLSMILILGILSVVYFYKQLLYKTIK